MNGQEFDIFNTYYKSYTVTEKQCKDGEKYGISKDWKDIAKDFSGISIPKFLMKRHDDQIDGWYYRWPAACGFIWNTNILKDMIHTNYILDDVFMQEDSIKLTRSMSISLSRQSSKIIKSTQSKKKKTGKIRDILSLLQHRKK
jgi:hypothetical protein